jgi:hypothetical protein
VTYSLTSEPSERDRELLDRINSFKTREEKEKEKSERIEEINTPGALLACLVL